MNNVVIPDYDYHAAGRVWRLPSLTLTVLPDGERAISQVEIDRIHTAIANELCGAPGSMTFEELEFLCDVTMTPFNQVAELLGLHKSTLSRWRQAGAVPREVYSNFLRKHFWFKLFGDHLRGNRIRLDTVVDDEAFLRYAHDEAIREQLAEPIPRAA